MFNNMFQLQARFEAAGVRVVIISFGQIRGAEFWLEETGCVFDMLLDPARKVRVKGVRRFEKIL